MSNKQRTLFLQVLCFIVVFSAISLTTYFLIGESTPAIAAGLIAAIAATLLWKYRLKHYFRIKRFDAVLPGSLYRSGQISRYNVRNVLRRYRICTVVDLSGMDTNPPCPDQQAEARAIESLGVDGHRFVMCGNGTGPLNCVADAVTRIHTALAENKRVLVHCAAGAQRTGHVVSAYLLLVRQANPQAVFHYMEKFGWDPAKDTAWPAQLNERMGELSEVLAERGVIETVPTQLPTFPEQRSKASETPIYCWLENAAFERDLATAKAGA